MSLSSAAANQFEPIDRLDYSLPHIQEVEGISAKIRQILREFKQVLQKLYGDRLAGIVLYDSFARCEENTASDVDV